jgi:hypothetical protein
MAATVSAQSGLFSAGTTWVGGVKPTTTSGFTVLATHVVTLDESLTTTAGTITITVATTPGTTVPGTLIISGGVTLQLNDGSTLTMNGLLDIQNGTLVQRDGCIFTEGANGAIYLAAGCTWADGNGGSCLLAGSVYINGTCDWTSDGTISQEAGVMYLREGTIAVSLILWFYSGTSFVWTGGSLSLLDSPSSVRFKGTAKCYMKRRGVCGPIDASQAYGMVSRPLYVGV